MNKTPSKRNQENVRELLTELATFSAYIPDSPDKRTLQALLKQMMSGKGSLEYMIRTIQKRIDNPRKPGFKNATRRNQNIKVWEAVATILKKYISSIQKNP